MNYEEKLEHLLSRGLAIHKQIKSEYTESHGTVFHWRDVQDMAHDLVLHLMDAIRYGELVNLDQEAENWTWQKCCMISREYRSKNIVPLDLLNEEPSTSAPQEDELNRRDVYECLYVCMNDLEERDRQVLRTLYWLDDCETNRMTDTRAACLLGITRQTVAVRKERALLQLKPSLISMGVTTGVF